MCMYVYVCITYMYVCTVHIFMYAYMYVWFLNTDDLTLRLQAIEFYLC